MLGSVSAQTTVMSHGGNNSASNFDRGTFQVHNTWFDIASLRLVDDVITNLYRSTRSARAPFKHGGTTIIPKSSWT
jgi:hypothetical protein